jgi:uncharacterized protein (DUF2236 family)
VTGLAVGGTPPGFHMAATTFKRTARDREADLQAELYDAVWGITVLMLAVPNVIMELARLPVGRGVAESIVESGRVDRHPIKRARTTVSYVAVALFGSDAERAAYRSEVARSHRDVHSREDSDVAYNAFDPELQLWVAACLYVGLEQAVAMTAPALTAERADSLYRYAARLGTTLQVTDEMWPPDREAFGEYWKAGLDMIEMDEVTRAYLYRLASLGFLPRPFPQLLGGAHRFVVSGFLPPPFRDELGLSWGPGRERVHARITSLIVAAHRFIPGPVRRFPVNAYLIDTRRRIRKGTAIV